MYTDSRINMGDKKWGRVKLGPEQRLIGEAEQELKKKTYTKI